MKDSDLMKGDCITLALIARKRSLLDRVLRRPKDFSGWLVIEKHDGMYDEKNKLADRATRS